MGWLHYVACETEYNKTDVLILGIIDLVSALLSVWGASFVVTHFLIYSRGLVFSRLIFWLSIADLGAAAFIAFSETWLLIEDYSFGTCVALRSFIEFFEVASWLWTACIAFYLYRTIVSNRDLFVKEEFRRQSAGTKVMFASFHAISWGVPFLLCVALAGGGLYAKAEGGWCHPKQPWQIILWELPMFLVFVFNLLLYAIIFACLYKRRQRTGLKDQVSWKLQMRLSIFLMVYIICWAPDLISHIVTLAFPHCWLFWMGLLQNLLAPAQGFLNCVVYALSNRQVRAQYSLGRLTVHVLLAPLLVIPVACVALQRQLYGMVMACSKQRKASARSDDDLAINYERLSSGYEAVRVGEEDEYHIDDY